MSVDFDYYESLILNQTNQIDDLFVKFYDQNSFIFCDMTTIAGEQLLYAQPLRFARDLFFNMSRIEKRVMLPIQSLEAILTNPVPKFNEKISLDDWNKNVYIAILPNRYTLSNQLSAQIRESISGEPVFENRTNRNLV